MQRLVPCAQALGQQMLDRLARKLRAGRAEQTLRGGIGKELAPRLDPALRCS